MMGMCINQSDLKIFLELYSYKNYHEESLKDFIDDTLAKSISNIDEEKSRRIFFCFYNP